MIQFILINRKFNPHYKPLINFVNLLKDMRKPSINDPRFDKFIAYLWVVLVGAALFLPIYLLIPYLHFNNSCPLSTFCSSVSTPWGTFTSLFIFDGWANLQVFIMWFAFFFLITIFMSAGLVKAYTRFIALALFLISIISNGVGGYRQKPKSGINFRFKSHSSIIIRR